MTSDIVYDPAEPNRVYLRPAPKSRPIRYFESLEQAGMIIDSKHSIAMYTSRAGAIAGPQGEPGDGRDTIIASCSDELTPITVGGPKTTFRAPYLLDMSNGYIRASLTQAPTGSAMTIDITMNGTSVFATLLTIDAGERTSVTAAVPAVLNIPGNTVPDDAEFLVSVTTIGSSFAGSGLKVAVTGDRVNP